MAKVDILVNTHGGIFSYIGDNCTLISYRHSGSLTEYKIGNSKFEEYSKNWRQLIYFDTKTLGTVFSRQYPSYNDNITKEVREFFEENISKVKGVENSWKVIKSRGTEFFEEYLEDCLVDGGDYDEDIALHYNDMLHDFEGDLIYNKELDNRCGINMLVGSRPICPVCGEHYIDNCSETNVICGDCEYEYGF